MKKYAALIVCLILLFPFTLCAALYQVGPGRTYQNLEEVADLLNPGDVVEVDGDHTYDGGVVFERPGTDALKIHIKGVRVNGRRPVISGGGNCVTFATPWPYTGPEGGHHYILEGFEITGGTYRGVFHQANDLIVRDCLVRDCPAHGILGADQGSGSLTLEYTEVTRCGSGDNRHQIYMATDEVNHPGSVFRMQHCYIHDGNGGNNVKSRAERNEIYYNRIEGAYYHELELIGPDSDADGGDPSLKREDSDVVGNVLIKKATSAGNNPDFSVTRIGGDGTGESRGRYRFVNNTILSGAGAVFRVFDTLESLEVHNNVLFNPTGDVLFKRTTEAIWVSGQETVFGGNNWIQTGAGEIPVQLTGTVSGNDPGFADTAQGNLFPAEGSPLIDAGHEPSSQAGFEFPDPLSLPLYLPPAGGVESLNAASARVITGVVDIGAFEATGSGTGDPDALHVDDGNTTGTQDGTADYPYTDIRTAVQNAENGDTIRIAAGTYGPVDTLNKSLRFLGGYAGADPAAYAAGQGGDFTSRTLNAALTVITGGTNQYGVTFTRSGNDPYQGLLEYVTISDSRKGIVFDTEISWPPAENVTIRNCIIENNGQAGDTTGGGGILVSGENVRIENNIIRNNRGGRGAGLARSGTPTNLVVRDNRIENNTCYDDHGGGVYLDGTVTLTGNVIDGNRVELGYGWGGGVLILGTAHLSSNIIRNNYAPSYGGGVFVDDGATAEMRNDLVYGNLTQQGTGAGVAVDGGYDGISRLTMDHCTVAFNNPDAVGDEYSLGGNGIFVDAGSSVTVVNSIFWANGDDDFYVRDGSTLTMTYSLSEEAWAGIGNLSADPLFADPDNGDFHPRSTAGRYVPATGSWVTDASHSPAIDAGDPASPWSAEPLPNGGRVNLGVFGNTSQAGLSKTVGPIPNLTRTQVSRLYVAIFGRASEGEGNRFWQTWKADGASKPDMASTATAMLATDAAKNYFGGSLDTDQAFIEHIYQLTLNKTQSDDGPGIAYWVSELDGGKTRGRVVADLVEVIQAYAPGGLYYDANDPVTIAAYHQFSNRVAVSDYMAETVEDLPDNWDTVTRFGPNGLNVTHDPATVVIAKAIMDNI